mgnify:CR=1 FL=1
MNKYTTVEELQEALSKDEIKAKLDELGVSYHPNSGHEKLAKKLFELAEIPEEKPKSRVNTAWEDLANSIVKESKTQAKKANRPKLKTYIAKDFNYQESPNGINSDGRRTRFVEGYATLSVAEQEAQGDIFPLNHIKFKGIENKTYNTMSGVKCRSILQTSNPTLQEYLETHKNFNQRFFEYDQTQVDKIAMEGRLKKSKLDNAVAIATEDDLTATLCYLDMKQGKDSFDSLSKVTDLGRLQGKALRYVDADPDAFIEAMKSKAAKIIFMINMAKRKGKLEVSRDGLSVIWSESNKEVCKSSRAENWQESLLNYLVTPEGKNLFMKLQDFTGVYVV